jgi:hypothetical protein
MRKLLIVVSLIVLLSILFSGCGIDNPDIALVKTGHLKMAEDVSIGDAFDKFFDKPHWEVFNSTDGVKVVEFTGKDADIGVVKVQFKLDGKDGFEVGAMSIDDKPQNAFSSTGLLKYIFEVYKKSRK